MRSNARRFFFMRCHCAPCQRQALCEGAVPSMPSRGTASLTVSASAVGPRPSDVLDPMPDRLCSAPRWFIDHWAYCVLGVDRSKWSAALPDNTAEVIERAYSADGWWAAHPWPGTFLPLVTPDRARVLCGTCCERQLRSDGALCTICDEFTCTECVGGRCAGCYNLVCMTCAREDFLSCAWCDARVCSVCAQDWIAQASCREDAGRDDEEYVCAKCALVCDGSACIFTHSCHAPQPLSW